MLVASLSPDCHSSVLLWRRKGPAPSVQKRTCPLTECLHLLPFSVLPLTPGHPPALSWALPSQLLKNEIISNGAGSHFVKCACIWGSNCVILDLNKTSVVGRRRPRGWALFPFSDPHAIPALPLSSSPELLGVMHFLKLIMCRRRFTTRR